MSLSLFTHTRTRTQAHFDCHVAVHLNLYWAAAISQLTLYKINLRLRRLCSQLNELHSAFVFGSQCTINLVEAAAVKRQPVPVIESFSQSVSRSLTQSAVTQHKSLFNSIWLLIAFRLAYKRLLSPGCLLLLLLPINNWLVMNASHTHTHIQSTWLCLWLCALSNAFCLRKANAICCLALNSLRIRHVCYTRHVARSFSFALSLLPATAVSFALHLPFWPTASHWTFIVMTSSKANESRQLLRTN